MIELIPAIDIMDGRCVRLEQGRYDRVTDYGDPLDMALRMQDHGIVRLHMVDLDGAASKHIVNYRTLERVAARTGLVIDFGGGVKGDDDLRIAFDSGAAMVTGGSVAVKQPDVFCSWLRTHGAGRIILGADVRGRDIAVNGWKEQSGSDLMAFLDFYTAEERGVSTVICTDISRDGMLQGPAVELYVEILQKHPSMHLIASGGVSGSDDIRRLDEAGVPAVIMGKALYEGRISWREIEEILGLK